QRSAHRLRTASIWCLSRSVALHAEGSQGDLQLVAPVHAARLRPTGSATELAPEHAPLALSPRYRIHLSDEWTPDRNLCGPRRRFLCLLIVRPKPWRRSSSVIAPLSNTSGSWKPRRGSRRTHPSRSKRLTPSSCTKRQPTTRFHRR